MISSNVAITSVPVVLRISLPLVPIARIKSATSPHAPTLRAVGTQPARLAPIPNLLNRVLDFPKSSAVSSRDVLGIVPIRPTKFAVIQFVATLEMLMSV